MFTEQPAPPHPVAEVQVQVADAAPAAPPAPARVATPEVVIAPVSTPAPAPTPAPAATPASSPPPAATSPAPAPTPNTATAQRRQEIEQTLLELTSKARAEQQAKQREQAETEAAKYGEAGELEEAQKIINNPALPANVRTALLKRLQAKQAKKGNHTLTAKGAKPGTKVTTTPARAGLATVGGSRNARDYATAPIIPLSQAQMQLRLGQLIGRNLNFAFPLSIPAPITSLFGWRIHPISGSPRFHRGIDFGAPIGTPIVAAKAGQVQTADTLDGYGLTVIVQHGKTQQTLYAHLSQIFVQPGQVVQKGQLLGLVGSTGNSTGPHLHFEVHEATTEGWVALDPAIALNGAIALAQNPQALAAARKPQSFNLAMSGLLDINLPTQTLPGFRLGNTALSGVLAGSGIPQDDIPAIGLQMSLALLPPTLPELGWLISPWVDDLAAQLELPLPGWAQLAQTFSFQPVPSLATVPAQPTGSAPMAFDPTSKFAEPAQFQLSTTKPLAGLTISEPISADIRRVPQLSSLPLVAPALPPTRDRAPIARQDAQRWQLTHRRIKPLEGS